MPVFAEQLVFDPSKPFFKGNLHCHSTVSDGRLTHAQLVEAYRGNGYHFLCFSDHEMYTDMRSLDLDDFIALPGVEWSCSLREDDLWKKTHHVHGIRGTEDMLARAAEKPFAHGAILPRLTYRGIETAEEMSGYLTARGCVTMYNHPLWSRTNPQDFGDLKGFQLLEIYNHGCNLENHTAFADVYWDQLLSAGVRICGVATDDNHNRGIPDDSFGGFIRVNAHGLSHDALMDAIVGGRFYSSNGPSIGQVGVQGGHVFVECDAVHRINFVAGGAIGLGRCFFSEDGEDSLTGAAYELTGRESYVRVECVDRLGKVAWSNPLYPDMA